MQIASRSHRFSKVFRDITVQSKKLNKCNIDKLYDLPCFWQRQQTRGLFRLSGSIDRICISPGIKLQYVGVRPTYSLIPKISFSSEPNESGGEPTEVVKELYQKILKSVEAKTMPPNAWMWSLLESCRKREDIVLLFQSLQTLRRFRLSNLRIHENFNSNLCLRVSEACARAGAMDLGKRALWSHNVYGLTPNVGSANYLLTYAQKKNDVRNMEKIMQLLKRNGLPLQPSTADIVFSICFNADRWDMISKYSSIFIKSGVQLRRTSFGTWMEFAAKRGDTEALWAIEKLRSDTVKRHNLATAFACAKGYLLDCHPENAAFIIHTLNENLPDEKRSGISMELQKLMSDWPLDVIKQLSNEDKKNRFESLEDNIRKMLNFLLNMGLDVTVDVESLTMKQPVPN